MVDQTICGNGCSSIDGCSGECDHQQDALTSHVLVLLGHQTCPCCGGALVHGEFDCANDCELDAVISGLNNNAKAFDAHIMRAYSLISRLALDLDAARDLNSRLQQEAGIHAQEARTANATIAEIYQLISGKTGEPGNWHGAEPVRKYVENVHQQISRIRKSAKAISEDLGEGDKVLCHQSQILHACAVAYPEWKEAEDNA